MKSVWGFLGSGLGFGWLPGMPGTYGSLVALLLCAAIFYLPLPALPAYLLSLALIALLAYFSLPAMISEQETDPQAFVLDEWLGQWISCLPMILGHSSGLLWWAGAFVLFRFFDISKVLGIDRLQKLPSFSGVMMDDVLASLYTLLCLESLIFGLKLLEI